VDNKTIAELHAQLTQLEGISDHLPAITNRLQQLAHLHVASANFTNRLARSEEVLENVQGLVANLTEAMSKLEHTMTDNLLVMDENLRKLEERLA
jgi:methyl-accepting chemotaxis protein